MVSVTASNHEDDKWCEGLIPQLPEKVREFLPEECGVGDGLRVRSHFVVLLIG